MRTVFSVADATCLDAVRKYAAELNDAGLSVRLEEIPIDDGWIEETAVRIEWGPSKAGAHDWEFEDDLGDEEEAVQPSHQRGLDDAPGRLAEHYLRTVQFLARNVEAARTWAARGRRTRKKRPR